MAQFLEVGTLRAVLIMMLIGFLWAGLHPFNFLPGNHVQWLQDSRGVRYDGYGEVWGRWPLRQDGRTLAATSALTFELWVASWEPPGPEVYDLLAIYPTRHAEPFALEQWRARLVVGGWVCDDQGTLRFKHIGIDNVFDPGKGRFLTITTGPEGAAIYTEGILQHRFPGFVLDAGNFDGTLLLGQTSRAGQEWHGEIFGLAIHGATLSPAEVAADYAIWRNGNLDDLRRRTPLAAIYPFDEQQGTTIHDRGSLSRDLEIPRPLRALYPMVLEPPSHRDLSNTSDIVLNVVGFIPFGALLAIFIKRTQSWSNRNTVFISVVAAAMISLVIELLQVFLPSRDSSLLDVINNVLGGAFGAVAGVAVWPYLARFTVRPSIRTARSSR